MGRPRAQCCPFPIVPHRPPFPIAPHSPSPPSPLVVAVVPKSASPRRMAPGGQGRAGCWAAPPQAAAFGAHRWVPAGGGLWGQLPFCCTPLSIGAARGAGWEQHMAALGAFTFCSSLSP